MEWKKVEELDDGFRYEARTGKEEISCVRQGSAYAPIWFLGLIKIDNGNCQTHRIGVFSSKKRALTAARQYMKKQKVDVV